MESSRSKGDAEKDPTEIQSSREDEWFVRNERFYYRINNEENGPCPLGYMKKGKEYEKRKPHAFVVIVGIGLFTLRCNCQTPVKGSKSGNI